MHWLVVLINILEDVELTKGYDTIKADIIFILYTW